MSNDRCNVLIFDNVPQNAETLKGYFQNRHPDWLIEVTDKEDDAIASMRRRHPWDLVLTDACPNADQPSRDILQAKLGNPSQAQCKVIVFTAHFPNEKLKRIFSEADDLLSSMDDTVEGMTLRQRIDRRAVELLAERPAHDLITDYNVENAIYGPIAFWPTVAAFMVRVINQAYDDLCEETGGAVSMTQLSAHLALESTKGFRGKQANVQFDQLENRIREMAGDVNVGKLPEFATRRRQGGIQVADSETGL